MVTRDQKMIVLAYHVASWSKDPSTRVGAVVVGQDPRQICFGYNGFPPGIADDKRLNDRPTKYRLIQHAERNVLDNATFDLTGATLYVTMPPCCECAKSIVSRRIARVVCPFPDQTPGHDKIHWRREFRWSKDILDEAGVSVNYYDAHDLAPAFAPIIDVVSWMTQNHPPPEAA